MTVDALIKRVFRMIRGIDNVGYEDIRELLTEEYYQVSDEFNIYPDIYEEITLDSIGSADISNFMTGEIRTVSLVEGSSFRQLDIVSEDERLRVDTEVDIQRAGDAQYVVYYPWLTPPRIQTVPAAAGGTVRVIGRKAPSLVADNLLIANQEPWIGQYSMHHMILAFKAAYDLLTEAGEGFENRAQNALVAYQRHKRGLKSAAPIIKIPVKTPLGAALSRKGVSVNVR